MGPSYRVYGPVDRLVTSLPRVFVSLVLISSHLFFQNLISVQPLGSTKESRNLSSVTSPSFSYLFWFSGLLRFIYIPTYSLTPTSSTFLWTRLNFSTLPKFYIKVVVFDSVSILVTSSPHLSNRVVHLTVFRIFIVRNRVNILESTLHLLNSIMEESQRTHTPL